MEDADVDSDAATDSLNDSEPDSVSDAIPDMEPDGPIDTRALPQDRIAPWLDRVGVEGGIPGRTEEHDCVADHGVPTDGAGDAAPAIRDCLAATPPGSAARLPAGTFRLESTVDGTALRIPAGVSLRGAGVDTVLSAETPLDTVVFMGAGHSESDLVPLASGAARGDDSFVLEDASGIAAGDHLLLNLLNDPELPVTPESAWGDGDCRWCDQFGGTRLRAQVVEVTDVTGDEVSIAPQALLFDLPSTLDPRAMRVDMETGAGIEDLTVRNGAGASSGWRVNVRLEGAANAWVKGVRVERCGKRCVDLRTYHYRVEVRDSTITGCIDHENSDACYGTEVAEGSNSLVENNVYHDTSNGPLLMWGASGNVVGYNYIHAVFRTHQADSWFWPNSWTHGAHTSYNLWEGNALSGLNWDSYWGSSSHNTAFRNHIDGQNASQGLVPGHIECAAVFVETHNTWASVVGNVLGTDGWSDAYEVGEAAFWSQNAIYAVGINGDNVSSTLLRDRNWDPVTGGIVSCEVDTVGCQGADPTAPLPPSLYLSGRPDWFGDVPWPPVDPEGPAVHALPAQLRFEAE